MPAERSTDVKFDIGHVLFIDIVGYSKGLINEQSESLQKLKEIVRGTEQFRLAEAEGKLLRLPTGDGGALVFRTSPEAPVLCALEIAKALQEYPGSKEKPQLRLRMGIHSGPVNEITDLNEQANIAGAGINLAQRVMDCGDAGHILVSKRVADDLEHYRQWRSLLHELGECEVKHGLRISVLNLYDDEAGNPEVPERLRKERGQAGLAGGASGAAPTALGLGSRPAIAVLPFDNRSNDPEQEYFADGLAEDLITRLSLWRSFPVIARNSSFVYKGKPVDVKKVSADLGVRYVVQGSVRKAGNQVRVAAQLIDASTGQHLWAKTYDRALTDVFAVQDEISEAIAASLVGDLQYVEHARARCRDPENLEAWGLYQRALPLIYSFTREDCAQARALLERAIALDPYFSTALARLAEVRIWEIMYEWTRDPERTLDVALAEARRAVSLDPLDAQARCNLSFALMVAKDGNGAQEEARHAAELNPSMPFALAIHAYHRYMAGSSPEESIALVQRALRLSPRDPVEWLFHDVLAGAFLAAERFSDGLEAGQRLIALSPNYYWGYLWSAMNAVGLGEIEEAHRLMREARRVKGELSFDLARKCLGRMAPDVEHRFCGALQQAGLEEGRETGT